MNKGHFYQFGKQVARNGRIVFQCETLEASFALMEALNKAVEETNLKFPNQIQTLPKPLSCTPAS